MNELLKGIYKIGMCDLWSKKITGHETEEQLLQMFSREPQLQEYCFSNDFPSLRWLQKNADIAEKYGVIVDREVQVSDPFFLAVFGSSVVNLECTRYSACHIAARHDATVALSAAPGAVVFIDVYDNAKVLQVSVPEGVKLKISRK